MVGRNEKHTHHSLDCTTDCAKNCDKNSAKAFEGVLNQSGGFHAAVLSEAEEGIIMPHFRRGYFKRLNSDFYKNKKGQIVFVHETVVNAKAKTLE